MGKSFSELIRFIMNLRRGQSNQAAQRQEVIRAAAGVE